MNDYNLKQRMLASIADLRAVREGKKQPDDYILDELTDEQITVVETFIKSFDTTKE